MKFILGLLAIISILAFLSGALVLIAGEYLQKKNADAATKAAFRKICWTLILSMTGTVFFGLWWLFHTE